MNWFYNIKISLKLIISFVIVAALAGIVGCIGIYNIKNIDTKYTEMYNTQGIPLSYIGNVSTYYQESRAYVKDIIIDKGSSARQSYVTKINDLDKLVDESLDKFSSTVASAEGKDALQALQAAIDKYRPVRTNVINLALANDEDKAIKLMRSDGSALASEIENQINKLMSIKVNNGSKISDDNTASTNNTVSLMTVIIIAAVIIAIALGVFVSRIISRPLIKLAEASRKLSEGDVNVSVISTSKDEIGQLTQSFEIMIENIKEQANIISKAAEGDYTLEVKVKGKDDFLGNKLSNMIEMNSEVIQGIKMASDQVSEGAKLISNSSQALSQSSTEQASSIEEITASISQIAAQTKENALNANEANTLATTGKDNAAKGNGQMQDMLKAMEDINHSSMNISKIIKVIDDIAFQTNILALNAAVEAARAGQQGKGFAVVAEEVRNLAGRSANAAKETTEMIENSIGKVEMGMKFASETAEALDSIVKDTDKVADLVAKIASASNEQASAIVQINTAISQVSDTTQGNSANSEESAAASEELASQAQMLKSMVEKFRLKGTNNYSNSLTIANSNNQGGFKAVKGDDKVKISLDDNEFGKYS